jgi:hypothetical protein
MMSIRRKRLASRWGRVNAWKCLRMTCVLAVTATAIFSIIHARGGHRYTPAPCQPAQSQVRGQCVRSIVAHIDPVPAFACMNTRGAVGNQIVDGACTAVTQRVTNTAESVSEKR